MPTDSRFYNAGRIAGDIVSGLQGIGEIIGGGGIDALGASACSTGGGVLTGPAIVAGNDLIAHGILVTLSGGFNLGKDLTNFFAQENEGTGSAQTGAQGGGGSNESVGGGARFADEAKLQDHFARHGRDFGARTPFEYQSQADTFLTGPKDPGVLEKTRVNGDIIRYNATTDEFGVISGSGNIKTYYKPDPAVHGRNSNLDYFNAQ